jgi:HlyD family secretion protein
MRVVKLDEPLPPPVPPPAPPHHGHHGLWRPWVAGALAALVVAGVGTVIEYRLHARRDPGPLVFLAPVTRGPVAARLRITGTLEPVETRTVTQPIAGRATEITVRPGDTVAAGQVVARFDPIAQRAEVARAESRLVAAEADAFGAELLLARLQRGAADEKNEDVADALAVAQARLATAAAEIEARTAAYRVAHRQLGDRVVRASLGGVVMARLVEPGQTVTGGAPVLIIGAAPRRLRLVAEAPETALAQVSIGQPARFGVPAYPGRAFEAQVTQRGWLRGPEGARHFPITLEVANEEGTLAFGMTASVDIDTGRAGPVFRVPVAALSFSPHAQGGHDDDQAIWVGDAHGSALVRTPVEVGASDGSQVEVRAPGLAEGAMVAVAFGRAPVR